MTSHLNSHRTTNIKPEMLSGAQPEMELHMINVIYAALPYVPSTLVWTNTLLYTLPPYHKSLDILEWNFVFKFLFSPFWWELQFTRDKKMFTNILGLLWQYDREYIGAKLKVTL